MALFTFSLIEVIIVEEDAETGERVWVVPGISCRWDGKLIVAEEEETDTGCGFVRDCEGIEVVSSISSSESLSTLRLGHSPI